MSGQILSLLAGMVRVAIPISFAALAGMLSERAGVINMGLEGIMLIGSFFAVVGSYVTGSAWMGLLFAALSGILMGLVLVTLTVGFKCEHVLAGVGINIFASGITIVLLEMIWGTKGKSSMVAGLGMLRVPVISKIPVIGDIIGTISPLFYILVLCVFLLWFLLYRTPAGLRILVIGENPEMAGTMGVNVYKMQYLCVMASGMLAAIGGAYLSIGDINMFSKDMVSGRGYIALSMVILGNWKPLWVALGGLVYGFAQSLQFGLQGVNIPPQLIQMLPYILELFWIGGRIMASGLAPVFVAIILWPRARRAPKATLLAMICGAAFNIAAQAYQSSAFAAMGGQNDVVTLFTLDPVLAGLPACFVVLIVGVLLETRGQTREYLLQYKAD